MPVSIANTFRSLAAMLTLTECLGGLSHVRFEASIHRRFKLAASAHSPIPRLLLELQCHQLALGLPEGHW